MSKAVIIEKIDQSPDQVDRVCITPLKYVDGSSLKRAMQKAKLELETATISISEGYNSLITPSLKAKECLAKTKSTNYPGKFPPASRNMLQMAKTCEKGLIRDLNTVFNDNQYFYTKKQKPKGKKQVKATPSNFTADGLETEEIAWLGKNNLLAIQYDTKKENSASPQYICKEQIPVESPKIVQDSYPSLNPLLQNAQLLLDKVEANEKLVNEQLANMSLTLSSCVSTLASSPLTRPKIRQYIIPNPPRTKHLPVIQQPEVDKERRPSPDGLLSSLTSEWIDQLLRTELEMF